MIVALLHWCGPTCVFGATPTADLVVIHGAGGEEEYEIAFRKWGQAWQDVASLSKMAIHTVGGGRGSPNDREALTQLIQRISREQQRPLWLVLIGHGTFFQDEAKFNLTGPDFSANELAQWLQPLKRPIAIINCASCSSPFIDRLSGPNRVVVTATRSGAEENFSRFGEYLADAIGQPTADVDHDGSVSLLEAFLTASRNTGAFYSDQGRLATEHALLDDNGDRIGTPADFFRGIRVVSKPEGHRDVDGRSAHGWMLSTASDVAPLAVEQRRRRDVIEQSIQALRDQKPSMSDDDYYEQLEKFMVQLARLYH